MLHGSSPLKRHSTGTCGGTRGGYLLTATAMGLNLKHARASVEEILAFAELERFANLQLRFYSSGMSARLSYATAFFSVQDILVLDEIFAVGDASFIKRCEKRFQELHAAGHTMLLVSHRPDIIENFCQRALLLEDGKIVVDDSSSKVAAEYLKRMEDSRLKNPLFGRTATFI